MLHSPTVNLSFVYRAGVAMLHALPDTLQGYIKGRIVVFRWEGRDGGTEGETEGRMRG